MNSIDLLRKKIFYRSEYRGIKEMELLLNSFVKKHINDFSITELKQLDKLLKRDLWLNAREALEHGLVDEIL